ncbi:xanthorhodopsin [Arthrobacter agilis]|uniref:bacteriorhodopsin-like n=1 Tax=Arthrobacter agilis TaxID=37921 RepID=UPI000B358552|nr:bacteriorhodopsin-like [Arthrobacter agilis]OUM42966.1 xanthorhodopsin [Arthrobacter agilis]PPB45911.1 xanthorhodopsin [Arthrobacter agilis]TPV25452.1 xanthorhodopsin [Arthrobacter agilis]VDR33193.1 Green-light absorbing proteorhodopsin precursor [Arthrobacter agilis]
MIPDSLTQAQFDTVYNSLSLVIASQLFTAIFLILALPRVLPRYRQAMVIAAVVCGIAAYHYFRIFDSFKGAFVTDAVGGRGTYTQAEGVSFNEGYRYVDWLLTVPLLLVELIAVLALARRVQASLLRKLIPAATLMIVLGYPGEISSTDGARVLWGVLSTIPFLFILYVLFVELTRSLDRQPVAVRALISRLRILLLASWLVYPLAYALPVLGISGADAWVLKQGGYSLADIAAKAVYALIIYRIARLKSYEDDPAFAAVEGEPTEGSTTVSTPTAG